MKWSCMFLNTKSRSKWEVNFSRGARRPASMLCAADRFADRNRCLLPKGYKPKRTINIRALVSEDLLQTGDLVLFSSRHAASNLTKCFTASVWDHVAIVVRPCKGYTFVVEWAGGVFASPLAERLTEYYHAQGRLIAVRRLSNGRCSRRSLQRSVESFTEHAMASGIGAGPPSVGEILRGVLCPPHLNDPLSRAVR